MPTAAARELLEQVSDIANRWATRDLLAAQQRCARTPARAQHLETRLSELLGEHAWRESGLGTPDDIDQLKQQIVSLEQHIIDLRLQLKERDQDLAGPHAPPTANS